MLLAVGQLRLSGVDRGLRGGNRGVARGAGRSLIAPASRVATDLGAPETVLGLRDLILQDGDLSGEARLDPVEILLGVGDRQLVRRDRLGGLVLGRGESGLRRLQTRLSRDDACPTLARFAWL